MNFLVHSNQSIVHRLIYLSFLMIIVTTALDRKLWTIDNGPSTFKQKVLPVSSPNYN